ERALRARYDGVHRNPWNEIECGNHYARSLASWGLLIGVSGAQWDAVGRTLAFDPVDVASSPTDSPNSLHRFLFTTGTGWGRVEITDDSLTVHLDGGDLDIAELLLRGEVIGRGIR